MTTRLRVVVHPGWIAVDTADAPPGPARQGTKRKEDFVTATRPLDQVAEAFELASSGQHVKVLVTVGDR